MKSVGFLQKASGFADYVIQTSSELTASLPQPDIYPRNALGAAHTKELPPGQWDGLDRRVDHQERRESERRNERLAAMLDTRVRMDRRRECRRQTDELELRSFSCRV